MRLPPALAALAVCIWLASCGAAEAVRHFTAPGPLPEVAPLRPAPAAPVLGPAGNLAAQLATWQGVAAEARTAIAAADEAKAQATARTRDAETNIRLLSDAEAAQARAADVAWMTRLALWIVAACILGAGLCVGLALWVPSMALFARGGGYAFAGIAVAALVLRGVLLYLPWVLAALGVALAVAAIYCVRKAVLRHAVELAEKEAQRLATHAHLTDLHRAVARLDLGAEVAQVRDKASEFLNPNPPAPLMVPM